MFLLPTFPTIHMYYFFNGEWFATMSTIVIISNVRKIPESQAKPRACSIALSQAKLSTEVPVVYGSCSWSSWTCGAGSVSLMPCAQGRHPLDTTLSERCGWRAGTLMTHHSPGQGARPYPVIHQKVILERKEAPDSGQGFWWRENMGWDGKGK